MNTEPSFDRTGSLSGKTILAISGSTRRDSWNTRLLGIMAAELGQRGLAISEHSFREQPLPLYDPDAEAETGVPEGVIRLRRLISKSDGLLVACPEYNGSVTPVLKNALDWASRPVGGEAGLAPFRMKPVLIVGTSIGPFGAVRAIGHLRAILGKMGALVMPEDLAVPNAATAFTDDGLADGATAAAARRAAAVFIDQLAEARV
ncbi:NAD(P)H-dependent oxidoreductase [Hyphomicrobiales bacterium]|nr:NAD(P)H-dependent oxidoreductase [Hyphomicrobiales bacterium]CAH1697360.1 NADPH-dependent oxidoreductase [Hyphomicrobiales bacterium]CAI0345549.1 chromate reductase, NAD(P)H dehydrogenase (quinone) [Hyphomicrobiales bacterium]